MPDEHNPLERVPYAVVVTLAYLALGLTFGLWHPAWILFLTIPIYEWWKRQEGEPFGHNNIAIMATFLVSATLMSFVIRSVASIGDTHWSIGWFSSPESGEVETEEGDVEGNETITQSLDASPVNNISLDWANGMAYLSVVSDAESNGMIEVVQKSTDGWRDTVRATVRIKDDTLYVRSYESGSLKSQGISSCARGRGKSVWITLPESCARRLESMSVDEGSGIIEISGISCNSLKAEIGSGSLSVTDCVVRDCDINLASGDATFDGELTSLGLDVASGTAELRSSRVPEKADMDVASGSVRLLLPKDAGFTARVDKVSGSFDTDFKTLERDGMLVAGDGAMSLKVDIASGNVRVGMR